MSNSTRVPRDEPGFNDWYAAFNHNLPSVADILGVSAGEQARVNNDSQLFPYLIARNNVVRTYKEDESKVKGRAFGGKFNDAAPVLPTLAVTKLPDGVTMNAGIQDYAELLVQRIVKSTGFNAEIEALLGIEVKGGDSLAPDQKKPVIKEAAASNEGVNLRCPMQGMKAYRVFSQRGAANDFEHIGDSSQPDFEDERPNALAGQPEKRQYKVIFLEKNKPVGEYSAIETVVTKP